MILEAVDRALTEALRLAVVNRGYLPDVTLYSDQQAWKQAKEELRLSLPDETLIDVFGIGTGRGRQEKTANKITIDRKAITLSPDMAGVSGVVSSVWDETLQKYRKVRGYLGYYDIDYEVRTVSSSTKFDRIMVSLIFATLYNYQMLSFFGKLGEYSHAYDNSFSISKDFDYGAGFQIEFLGSTDLLPDENWLERIYRYRARRIPLDEEIEIEHVAPLLEVKVDVTPVPKDTDFFDENKLEELNEELPKGTAYVPPTREKW